MLTKTIKIDINGWNWTVQAVPKKSKNLYIDDEECYGVCDLENFIIYICSTEISKELQFSTIIHELVHAYFTVSGFRQPGDTYCEEDFCAFFQWNGREILKKAEEVYKGLFEEKKKK